MTDARYPERWLNDRRLLRLSDAGHRLFVTSLAWSVSNRTDGVLHDDDLGLIPTVDPGGAAELAKAGLWQRDRDRWLIVDYTATQTTAAQLAGLDHKRAVDRERQARHRARRAASRPSASTTQTTDVTRDVPGDVPGDGTRDTKDRTGQAKDRPGAVNDSRNGAPPTHTQPADRTDRLTVRAQERWERSYDD